ncbi:MAG: hypothetical protein JXK93_12180 [Sphaerochaetaceae bacterium]|nr:hypothetical protein [Sphaerochaetaceae bacterium]
MTGKHVPTPMRATRHEEYVPAYRGNSIVMMMLIPTFSQKPSLTNGQLVR